MSSMNYPGLSRREFLEATASPGATLAFDVGAPGQAAFGGIAIPPKAQRAIGS